MISCTTNPKKTNKKQNHNGMDISVFVSGPSSAPRTLLNPGFLMYVLPERTPISGGAATTNTDIAVGNNSRKREEKKEKQNKGTDIISDMAPKKATRDMAISPTKPNQTNEEKEKRKPIPSQHQ